MSHTPQKCFTSSRLPLLVTLVASMSVMMPRGVRAAEGEVPRVVVSILIDQLRTDYLNAFMPLYGQEGFVRLLSEGSVYSQAEYPNNNPDRASAAATLVTGTTPYNHGIVARQWLDRTNLQPVFCVDDKKYAGVQTYESSAPTNLAVSTVSDELKVATEGKALVYSFAPFRDAAVLTAGHAADGAFWIDDLSGRWCTTSYYSSGLPIWISVLNTHGLDERLKTLTWTPSSELVGNFSYFLSGGMKEPFEHQFREADRFAAFKTSGLVNEEVVRAMKQCLTNTSVGKDEVTDFLAVTLYAGNFNHATATEAPMELQDTYVRLDAALERLIKAVEEKAGKGNALFVLTSTGYVDEETADLSKYKIPTGIFDVERASSLLNMYLAAVYGTGQYVQASLGTQFYFNHKLIEDKQINFAELLERSQDFILQLSGVKDVYTSSRLLQGAWTPGISRLRGAYNPKYSGDLLIEVAPGWRYVNKTQQENKLVRESYVPFPIIFFGPDFPAETIHTPVTIDCIAPTLSKAIRIRAPNGCNTKPL